MGGLCGNCTPKLAEHCRFEGLCMFLRGQPPLKPSDHLQSSSPANGHVMAPVPHCVDDGPPVDTGAAGCGILLEVGRKDLEGGLCGRPQLQGNPGAQALHSRTASRYVALVLLAVLAPGKEATCVPTLPLICPWP